MHDVIEPCGEVRIESTGKNQLPVDEVDEPECEADKH